MCWIALPMRRDTNFSWVSDMRQRRYLTFDMSNSRHVEALEIVSAQPDKLRSEYIISCILQAKQEQRMEEMLRRVFSEMMMGRRMTVQQEQTISPTTEDISDLPDVLLTMMENF